MITIICKRRIESRDRVVNILAQNQHNIPVYELMKYRVKYMHIS